MGLSGVQRISKFVKYLPEYGWMPHIIAPGPTPYYAHDPSLLGEFQGRELLISRTEQVEENDDPHAKTVKMPSEPLRKIASRLSNAVIMPDNKRMWSKRALDYARTLVNEYHYDMIFVSGPPFSTMMAGAQLSAETGIPLVLDYRDLWLDNQFHTYLTPWHRGQHKRLEHSTLARAAKVTVTNRYIKEHLLRHYPHLEYNDVIILPHGYDPEDLDKASSNTEIRDPDVFRLTYSGIFYDFVTPVPFFKAMKRVMKKRPDIKIELHFAGLLRDANLRTAKRAGLESMVVDHGYLPHQETVDLITNSDALWMMVGETKSSETISSGKLYEYFGTKKPILASVPKGALRSDAEKYGAAWITAPADVKAIAASIIEMYDLWKSNNLPKPDDSEVAKYDRQQLAGSLARVLAGSLRVI